MTTSTPSTLEQRFEQLEQRISQGKLGDSFQMLDEYVDLGLTLAADANDKRMMLVQESFLSRLYRTMLKGANNPRHTLVSQEQHREFLHPLFCVLKHFYQSQPNGEEQLKYLDQSLGKSAYRIV